MGVAAVMQAQRSDKRWTWQDYNRKYCKAKLRDPAFIIAAT
jgi:hypothetical protein